MNTDSSIWGRLATKRKRRQAVAGGGYRVRAMEETAVYLCATGSEAQHYLPALTTAVAF